MSIDKTVVNLRTVADRVGLAPCSVSAILNRTAAAKAIPQRTQDRVFRAAAELNYQPNLSARSLRTKRTHMIALLSKDFAQTETGLFVGHIERRLRERGYLLVLGSVGHSGDWPRLSILLRQRGVEGLIITGMSTPRDVSIPAVSVHAGLCSAEESVRGTESVGAVADSVIEALLTKIENRATGNSRGPGPSEPGYVPVYTAGFGTAVELG